LAAGRRSLCRFGRLVDRTFDCDRISLFLFDAPGFNPILLLQPQTAAEYQKV
jgi:hypothetical protein